MKADRTSMKEVKSDITEQKPMLLWREGWSCYYADHQNDIIYVLPKSSLNTEQKKEWRERHGWPGKQRAVGLTFMICMMTSVALTFTYLLRLIAIFLAFGIW